MMALSEIIHNNELLARKAKRAGKVPYVFTADDLARLSNTGEQFNEREQSSPLARVPNIGSYDLPGWEVIDTHFVDHSGFGAYGEPAMTIAEFRKFAASRPTSGWAIVEVGQFQLYIREYRKGMIP